jgi:PP-loop superfamily ATP-utilizing enzyme
LGWNEHDECVLCTKEVVEVLDEEELECAFGDCGVEVEGFGGLA